MNAAQEHLQTLADIDLDAVTAKDTDVVVASFSEDGVFIDPHYPYPELRGKAAIREGLEWGFSSMKIFAFDNRRYYYNADDTSLTVLCDCHHVLNGGRHLDFPQVFVMDARDGHITRWQAFEPYGPNGVGGLFLGIGKTVYRARRTMRRRSSRSIEK